LTKELENLNINYCHFLHINQSNENFNYIFKRTSKPASLFSNQENKLCAASKVSAHNITHLRLRGIKQFLFIDINKIHFKILGARINQIMCKQQYNDNCNLICCLRVNFKDPFTSLLLSC
jgi:hypothetical protein